MDCSICLEKIKNGCKSSCSHYFCFPCLLNWFLYGGKNCPLCKTFIHEIKLDSVIKYPIVPNQINTTSCKHIIIDFPKKSFSLSLENHLGYGIKVKSLKRSSQGFLSGLRKNDLILFINNIPCVDKYQSGWIIKKCTENGTPLDFLILIC